MNRSLKVAHLISIIRHAADAAAAVVRGSAHPERYTGTVNAGGDRVLAVDVAADREAQRVLADALGAEGLPYAVFSEESGYLAHGGDYPLFVIDPVDGSAQARRRHPDCAVSIAAAVGPTMGDVVAAVVQPIWGGPPFSAVRGEGAWLGEAPLPLVPAPDGPARSALVEGMDATATVAMARRVAAYDPVCQVHISGSIALQLALLAAGCYDLLIAARRGASAHDIAAGWLIGMETGIALADLGGPDLAHTPLVGIEVQHQIAGARRHDLLRTALAIAHGEAGER